MRSVRSVGVALVLIFSCYSPCFAQLGGSIGLGMTTYQNAEGTDTSTADRALTPDLELDYTVKLSPLSTLKPSFALQYDLYLGKPERSYLSLYPDLTYRVYLSNQEAIRKEAESTTASALLDSSAQRLVAHISALADSTLNLRVGIERTALKEDAIEEIQTDIAATLLAYVGLLEEMGLTQSFKEVLLEELATIKERTALLGVPKNEYAAYLRSVDGVSTFLMNTTAVSDYGLTASAGEESVQQEQTEEPETKQASIITLISNGLDRFASSRFYTKYYLSEIYATTYATKLTVPLSVDYRKYRPDYASYTYTTVRFQPKIDLYTSSTVGLGFEYLFERSQFPNASLYTFNEHALRADARIELSSSLALVTELGLGRRTYPNPMSITLRQGPRSTTYTTPNNYLRFAPAVALIAFPFEKLSLGAAARITRNPNDNVVYLGGVSSQRFTNSSYFGLASDESYIYEAKTLSAALTAMLPLNIELGADVVHENRPYPDPPNIPGVRSITRSDEAFWASGVLSKYVIFDRAVLGLEYIYPRVSVTYTDLTSNLSGFGYTDFSFTAAITVGF